MPNSQYDKFIKILNNEKGDLCHDRVDRAKEAVENGCKIHIWPAARMGNVIYKAFIDNGFFNIIRLDEKNNDDDTVILPSQANVGNDSVLIICSLSYSNEIYHKAIKMNFPHIMMYYEAVNLLDPKVNSFPDDFYIDIFKNLKIHLLENKNKYHEMYDCLEDDLSRKYFLNNMLFRLTGDITYTFDCDDNLPQYFNDLTGPFSDDIVFVDGGGYIGDTLEQFIAYANNQFKSYYLFEPDSLLLAKARKISSDKRIHYICKGLHSEAGDSFFTSTDGPGGALSAYGDKKITLVSIDSEINEKIDFIKMDIEGSELAALKGAQKTIQQDKPKLAICLYHKAEDYTTIFNFIREANPDYRFYLRHHLNNYTETVLYAV